MAASNTDGSGGAILPAPACDLLDRFTTELGVPLSLTDLHGAVLASTGGLLAGQIDADVADRLKEWGSDVDRAVAAAVNGRICLPLLLTGRMAGALVVHEAGERARLAAPIVAIALGLALDFAEVASSLGGTQINPGWLLRSLLCGTREEAQRTRVVSSIYGWNLFVQRVAFVILVPASDLRRHPRPEDLGALIERALNPEGSRVPSGQIDETVWVVLPRYDRGDSWAKIGQAAHAVHRALASAGLEASIGIGEPHLPNNRIAALRRSYREAVYAARLGRRLRQSGGVFELRSLGPAAFFAPSSPSRRNLATVVLAPLREQPAVLQTLQVFLKRDMSVAATAAQLKLHRHTVRAHLERIVSLTGLDPRSLEGAVQLKLALLVASSEPEVLEGGGADGLGARASAERGRNPVGGSP